MSTVRGFALVVALIMLAAMGLASTALVRAVDTATAVGGNLALREASIPAADGAIEAAIAAVYETAAIADPERNLVAQSYYASRQQGEDPRGIPSALLSVAAYPDGARVVDAGNGHTLRYLIERMCVGAGPPTPANCALLTVPPPDDAAPAPPPVPFYRVTARVDGPGNTVTHVQAMVRASTPPRRLAWRLVAE